MGIPTWTVGEVLSSSDVNTWFVPLAVTKTADQSVTSSTTLVNDNELLLSLAANAVYEFRCTLDYEGGTQGASDLKWGWSVPSGTIMRYTRIGIDTAGASTAGFMTTESSTVAGGTAGAGSLKGVLMDGVIDTGSTAGTLQLKWAQNTSSATATIVHALSKLIAQRVG